MTIKTKRVTDPISVLALLVGLDYEKIFVGPD